MRAEVTFSLAGLYGFLLVLARVASVAVFAPIPGVRQGAEAPRIVFALAFTLALFPYWPEPTPAPAMGQLAAWLLLEAAFGLLVGLGVSFVTEAFLMAAQTVGLPAGYAYASVVDPQTQADSGVLLVFAQLASGLLFFALGLERETLRVFARSLEAYPPGSLDLSGKAGEAVIRLGSGVFSTGLRLALPALALLAMVDIALALLGRLNAQLQLLTLAFPVKMLATVLLLAWIAVLFPRIFGGYAAQVFGVLHGLALPWGR